MILLYLFWREPTIKFKDNVTCDQCVQMENMSITKEAEQCGASGDKSVWLNGNGKHSDYYEQSRFSSVSTGKCWWVRDYSNYSVAEWTTQFFFFLYFLIFLLYYKKLNNRRSIL